MSNLIKSNNNKELSFLETLNSQPIIDTLKLAEITERNHFDILKYFQKSTTALSASVVSINELHFPKKDFYLDKKGEKRPYYLLNYDNLDKFVNSIFGKKNNYKNIEDLKNMLKLRLNEVQNNFAKLIKQKIEQNLLRVQSKEEAKKFIEGNSQYDTKYKHCLVSYIMFKKYPRQVRKIHGEKLNIKIYNHHDYLNSEGQEFMSEVRKYILRQEKKGLTVEEACKKTLKAYDCEEEGLENFLQEIKNNTLTMKEQKRIQENVLNQKPQIEDSSKYQFETFFDKAKRQVEEYFDGITLDETSHQYTVNGEKVTMSVTKFLQKFTYPFNSKAISKAYAAKHGLDQQEVLEEWKQAGIEACRLGTRVHNFAEKYALDRSLTATDGFEEAIVKFWDNMHEKGCTPLVLEQCMYHKKYKISGTADIVIINRNSNKIGIIDIKTNKDLEKNFKGQKLKEPFTDLLNKKFNIYQLQLSMYKLFFEQCGLEVYRTGILHVKEDGTYNLFNTDDYSGRLINFLESRGDE